jgi:hypothetical protein
MAVVNVPEITAQAREVRLGRLLLTIVGFVFFAAGWAASICWLAICWCAVAVRTGWRAAQQRDGGG